jgi:lysophospholipase L1-like esterase
MTARLAALVISSLVALALAELGARLFVSVREIGPTFSVYDPILGARHKQNLTATRRTPEFTMQISTNSRGQRGPETVAEDQEAAARIVFVGDSFTQGYGVDDGEEFPRLVAARLEAEGIRAEVLNEGVGDTGTGRALRLVSGYASEPGCPTILVYQFSVNDVGDDYRDGFFTLDESGGLVEAPLPVPRSRLRRLQPLVDAIPGLSNSHLFAAMMQVARARRQLERVDLTPSRETYPASEKLTLRLIAEIIATARGRGWQVVVLTANASPAVSARIETLARSMSVEFVWVPAKAERPDLYYRVDGHWNPAGHVEAATRLQEPIERMLSRPVSR